MKPFIRVKPLSEKSFQHDFWRLPWPKHKV